MYYQNNAETSKWSVARLKFDGENVKAFEWDDPPEYLAAWGTPHIDARARCSWMMCRYVLRMEQSSGVPQCAPHAMSNARALLFLYAAALIYCAVWVCLGGHVNRSIRASDAAQSALQSRETDTTSAAHAIMSVATLVLHLLHLLLLPSLLRLCPCSDVPLVALTSWRQSSEQRSLRCKSSVVPQSWHWPPRLANMESRSQSDWRTVEWFQAVLIRKTPSDHGAHNHTRVGRHWSQLHRTHLSPHASSLAACYFKQRS